MLGTLLAKITQWLSLSPDPDPTSYLKINTINPRGISHSDDASGGVVTFGDESWIFGLGSDQQLQIHHLSHDSLETWQTDAGDFANLMVSKTGDSLTFAFETSNGEDYLAHLDPTATISTANLTLPQWRFSHTDGCNTHLKSIAPYYDHGDANMVAVAGTEECLQELPRPWVGLFDYDRQQLTKPRQLPSTANHQTSIYYPNTELHLVIDGNTQLIISHGNSQAIDEKIPVQEVIYSSSVVAHYHARIVEHTSGYYLCAFSYLTEMRVYGFLIMNLPTNLGVPNEQWFTLLPNHIYIPDPKQVTFDCTASSNGYVMSATWPSLARVGKSIIVGGDVVPCWMVYPKEGSSLSVSVHSLSSTPNYIKAATSYVEGSTPYAGDIDLDLLLSSAQQDSNNTKPANSHARMLSVFLPKKTVGFCDLHLDTNPIYIGSSLSRTAGSTHLLPTKQILLETLPLGFTRNILTQIFPACRDCYPTSEPTNSVTPPPGPTDEPTHSVTLPPGPTSDTPTALVTLQPTPSISDIPTDAETPWSSPSTPDSDANQRLWLLLLTLLIPIMYWVKQRTRNDHQARLCLEQDDPTRREFIRNLQQPDGIENLERYGLM